VRKAGKLPADTLSVKYDLEYGQEELFIHKDAFEPGSRALIVDDLLATGGTSDAIAELVTKAGAQVAGYLSLIELTYLDGVKHMDGVRCESIIKIDS